MDLSFFWLAVGVILVSVILNWGVQLGYYFWRKGKKPRAFVGQKTLLNYYTGYLGDGIIVPLINVLILYIIVRTGVRVSLLAVEVSLGAGLVIDIVAHYLQGKLKLTNWSMPKPFQWNFAGYWHMVSFPIQMAYLTLFFWTIWVKQTVIWPNLGLGLAVLGVLGLMIFFCLLYAKDNHWL